MNCDPAELVRLSRCYCFNRVQQRAVWIYLLCRWAQEVAPPVVPFSYTPPTELVSWEDSGGAHPAVDLATFNLLADKPTVEVVDVSNTAVTSIVGLSSLPILKAVIADYTLIGILDLSGCSNIVNIGASFCPFLSNVTGISPGALLITVNANNDILPSSVVNYLLIACDTGGVNTGAIDTSNQTPAAPPSGTGIIAKNNLLAPARGPWTVITD